MVTRELNRTFQKRRPLSDFLGVISKEEGQAMLDDLKRIKEEQGKLHKERIKRLHNRF